MQYLADEEVCRKASTENSFLILKCGNNINKTILEGKRWEFDMLFSTVQLQRAVVEQIMGHNWHFSQQSVERVCKQSAS